MFSFVISTVPIVISLRRQSYSLTGNPDAGALRSGEISFSHFELNTVISTLSRNLRDVSTRAYARLNMTNIDTLVSLVAQHDKKMFRRRSLRSLAQHDRCPHFV